MSNELDRQISEKLHGYESAVDAEAIWAAVRQPRRRRPWLWLILLFGVLGLAGAGWWQYSQQANLSVAEVLEDNSASERTVAQPSNIDSSFGTGNQAATSEITHIAPEKEHIADAAETLQSSAPVSATHTLANQSIKTAVAKNNATSNSELINASEVDQVVENMMATSQNDETETELELNAPEEVELATNEQPAETESGVASTDDKNEQELRVLNSVDYRLATLKGLLTTSPKLLDEEIIPLDNYRRSRKRGSPWSVQLDAAYLRLDRELSSDSLSSWIDNRLATESTLEGLSSDLTVGYAFRRNWQLRAGLGYTQINTQFSLNNTISTVDTVEGLQVVIINPDNTRDSIFGPVAFYETTERRQKIYNSFRQWELPVLLSYESGFGHLSVIGEAGARIRFRRSWEGMVLAENGEEVIELAEQDFYRTNIGLSLQAGLHLGYELSSQLQIRVGGTMRYSLKDFSRENIGFQERYQLMGLQLGLRYSIR